MSNRIEADVLVLGGGPGGYAAAFRAADLGRDVLVVEQEQSLGGTCLLYGCIPSKALIAVAELLERVRAAESIGIRFQQLSIDLARLMAWKQEVVRRMADGLAQLASRRRVRHLCATGRFDSPGILTAITATGETVVVSYRVAVIATGAEPWYPAGLEPDGELVLNSSQMLARERLPARLLVVGGGYIGLELGTCWQRFGAEVTIVELTESLLPGTDPELLRPVRRQLDRLGLRLLLASEVVDLKRGAAEAEVTIRRASGEHITERFDAVLVCAGRKPRTERLGLSRLGVQLDDAGRIACDEQCRTQVPDLYAIGDCVAGPMLAHRARRDGIVAAESICGIDTARRDQQAIPAVVFSSPEIATCGLSEQEAKRAGLQVRIGRFPMQASGRAWTENAAEGLVKLVVDASDGRVLGAGIVSAHASELIAEAALAIEAGVTVRQLMHTVHAHPTFAESLQEAAETVEGACLHIYKPPLRSPRRPGS
jgi:dihydrolipoamide dehydrogenase